MEDLSKLKPQAALFQTYAKPALWTNAQGFEDGGEEPVTPTKFAFGFWCGEELCLLPLQAGDHRIGYWRAPVCDSADDAKRMWFIVQKLMDALGGTL